MRLIYTPDGEPRQEFPFELGGLLSPEAEAIENVGGESWGTYEEFGEKLSRGGLRAKRALLWVMLRRTDPRLRFSDVVVAFDELSFATDEPDREAARAVLALDGLTDEERTELELIADDSDDGSPVPFVAAAEPQGKEPAAATPTASP